MRVLVVNAGSSSLKLAVVEGAQLVAAESSPFDGAQVDGGFIRDVIASAGRIDAVGHRVVHGGTEFLTATRIDDGVRRKLGALIDLAPLHQPKSLAALDAVTDELPGTLAVACFDTAFHATIPDEASTYALPVEWRRRWPLRRFGFHGLSHAYASRRVAELVGKPSHELRIVSCHLGAGASVTAIGGGRSVDTSMGFTPLEGLVMATRSGSIDPGLLLWLQEHAGMPSGELAQTLETRSGLRGLAGTADLKEVFDREQGGDPDAVLAAGVYLHRLRAVIAAMASSMNGLDVLLFTGGAGEKSSPLRSRACEGLAFLGVTVDRTLNDAADPDCEITQHGARVRTFVIEAREDLQIAGEVAAALA